MRLFCPWNSPGNKHSGPSKPNILRPYLPSAGPLDWESWCVYWIPQSLWRTSLFNYNSSYFWNIGLDYTTSLPLLPISVWFLLYIFSHRFFFWVISVFMNKWSKWSHSVMSDSLRPHWLWPTRLLHPWDFPGKSTGVGCHCLLHRIFPTQGSNPSPPHCRQMLYHLSHQGSSCPINSCNFGVPMGGGELRVFLLCQFLTC